MKNKNLIIGLVVVGAGVWLWQRNRTKAGNGTSAFGGRRSMGRADVNVYACPNPAYNCQGQCESANGTWHEAGSSQGGNTGACAMSAGASNPFVTGPRMRR